MYNVKKVSFQKKIAEMPFPKITGLTPKIGLRALKPFEVVPLRRPYESLPKKQCVLTTTEISNEIKIELQYVYILFFEKDMCFICKSHV